MNAWQRLLRLVADHGKGPKAVLCIILAIAIGLTTLVVVSPPVGVWIGALLMMSSAAGPLLANTHEDDLFDDGLECGILLMWPIFLVGMVGLLASLIWWAL